MVGDFISYWAFKTLDAISLFIIVDDLHKTEQILWKVQVGTQIVLWEFTPCRFYQGPRGSQLGQKGDWRVYFAKKTFFSTFDDQKIWKIL